MAHATDNFTLRGVVGAFGRFMSYGPKLNRPIKHSRLVKSSPPEIQSPAIIARAMVGHAVPKKERIVVDLSKKKDELKSLSREFNRIELQHKLLAKSPQKLAADYQGVIKKLLEHKLIKSVKMDEKKRIVIYTASLKVKKTNWRKERIAGVYQIGIDFSKESIQDGIKIINTTRRYNEYDSPTIKDGHPCWGNIVDDVKREFFAQDLYELVVDLIDYIRSPDDDSGYLEWSKKHTGGKCGWEQFFDRAKKHKQKFTLREYYNDIPRTTANVSVSTFLSTSSSDIPQSTTSTTLVPEELRPQYHGPYRMRYKQNIERFVIGESRRRGFSPSLAGYILDKIYEETYSSLFDAEIVNMDFNFALRGYFNTYSRRVRVRIFYRRRLGFSDFIIDSSSLDTTSTSTITSTISEVMLDIEIPAIMLPDIFGGSGGGGGYNGNRLAPVASRNHEEERVQW